MKKISKKQIITNAEKRLKEMKFDLAFYENIYNKIKTENNLNKINLLKQDIIELENELNIFINGGK